MSPCPVAIPVARDNITGVILAGGRATRMNGADKGLMHYDGAALVQHVITGLRPQVHTIMISANRNLPEYETEGYPVVSDTPPQFLGPLAGIASALEHITTAWALIVPCDAPRLAADLAERLLRAAPANRPNPRVAHDGHALQPVFCLVPRSARRALQRYLDRGGRSVREWLQREGALEVSFSDCPEAFANLNCLSDIAAWSDFRSDATC